jgi:D-alanyl-lipoteichoic acid acyltransferase DltB (MBOAT superfamily)
MVFTSGSFIVFFCIFYPLFILTPHRGRLYFLLAASLFFFGYAHPSYLWILLLVIGISYIAGIAIASDPRRKKLYVWTAVLALLGLLGYFKYADFLISLAIDAGKALNLPVSIKPLGILLPIGISFFVFQAISYVVDVYRGDKAAERNLVVLALFKSFFPQLVAGPIERSTHLLPQLRRAFIDGKSENLVMPAAVRSGCELILFGFFKKVCVADNVALFSDSVFAAPSSFGAILAYLGVICFAVQIYCDFSGYTDIARGISRIMGVELMENFRQPYFSASIREFWTRWHISLSTWFRDYLYKPLGGNRVSYGQWLINSLAVFLLSGLWHGAAVNFIIWGGVHGVIYIAEQSVARTYRKWVPRRDDRPLWQDRASRALAIVFTFHVVCFAWIFFRAATFGEAMAVIKAIVGPFYDILQGSTNYRALVEKSEFFARDSFLWVCLFSALLFVVDFTIERRGTTTLRMWSVPTFRWLTYFLAALAIVFLGNWSNAQQFIYFQF